MAAASLVQPVFLEQRAPVAQRILQHRYVDSLGLRAPWLRHEAQIAIKSEQFRADREAFALDLIRTGKVTPLRARSLADVAVREAYTQKIPPALVLGVMLTENDEIKSRARSKVGAVGLMQVYGKHWRGALGAKFGTNLRDDATNLRYGIYILKWTARQVEDFTIDGWRDALLKYNGCVRGRNTPDCRVYPEVVKHNVERAAKASCAGRDFHACIVQPMLVAQQTEAQQKQNRAD